MTPHKMYTNTQDRQKSDLQSEVALAKNNNLNPVEGDLKNRWYDIR